MIGSARLISDQGNRWEHALNVCDALDLQCEHSPAVFLSDKEAQEHAARPLETEFHSMFTKGAVGCYLAHKNAWSEIAKHTDEKYHVVFEDDVALPNVETDEVKGKIDSILRQAAADGSDFVQLGHSHRRDARLNLHAYALKPSAAKRLASIADSKISRPIDNLTRDACQHGTLKCASLPEDLPNKGHTYTAGLLKQLKRTNDNPSRVEPHARDQLFLYKASLS